MAKAFFYNMSESAITVLVNGSMKHILNLAPPALGQEAHLKGGSVDRADTASGGVMGMNGSNEIKFWSGDDVDYAVTVAVPAGKDLATPNRDLHLFVFPGTIALRDDDGNLHTYQPSS